MEKKPLSVKLPRALEARLRESAKAREVTTSDVVREAVAAYLSRPEQARPGSALDLAGDLAGCLEGPSDLATNPKYMEDFGK
jgi:Arc/MetJ-type ribon-helix-helix transcriptional regulator